MLNKKPGKKTQPLPEDIGFFRRYGRQMVFQSLALAALLVTLLLTTVAIAMPIISIIFFAAITTVKLSEDYQLNKDKLKKEDIKINNMQVAIDGKFAKLQALAANNPELSRQFSGILNDQRTSFENYIEPTKQKKRGLFGNGLALGLIVTASILLLLALSFIPGVNLAVFSIFFTLTCVGAREILIISEGRVVKNAHSETMDLADKYARLLELESRINRIVKLDPNDQAIAHKIELAKNKAANLDMGKRVEQDPNENKLTTIIRGNKIALLGFALFAAASVIGLLFAPVLIVFPVISIGFVVVQTAVVMYDDFKAAQANMAREEKKNEQLGKIVNNLEKEPGAKPIEKDNTEGHEKIDKGITDKGTEIVAAALAIAATAIAVAFIPGVNVAVFSAVFAFLAGTIRWGVRNLEQNAVREAIDKNVTLTERIAEKEIEKTRDNVIDNTRDITHQRSHFAQKLANKVEHGNNQHSR